MASRLRPKIAEAEWNFLPVPAAQELACLVWELARESATIRNKIEARRRRGGSSVLVSASAIKFTADALYFDFKVHSLLDFFPDFPWQTIPAEITSACEESGLNRFLLKFGESRAFTPMHGEKNTPPGAKNLRTQEEFMALAERHIVPFRALVNLSFDDNAIKAEFGKWLTEIRAKAGIEGTISKPGLTAKKVGRPKADPQTSLNRLAIMRLFHAAPFDEARKMAEKSKARFRYDEGGEAQWYQERKKVKEILHDFFSEVPEDETPLKFSTFLARKQ